MEFKAGTKVILNTTKYNCDTRKYHPYRKLCEVVEYCYKYGNRVLLSEYPGQKRDYNIWCSVENVEYAGENVVLFKDAR